MNNHYAAVEDCQRAIDMDPKYGKAYGRMGLAYSSVEKHKEAIECFKKAIDIEPENESYHSNLKLAEEKMASSGSPGAGILGKAYIQTFYLAEYIYTIVILSKTSIYLYQQLQHFHQE